MTPYTEFAELLRQAASAAGQPDIPDFDMRDPIAKLGLDSIVMFEVVGYFEQQLQLRLPDDRLARVRTVQDLADLVEDCRSA